MAIDSIKVGNQISLLRKSKNFTQNELGERLNITFQAISKWERGETLPDTAILTELANALETTVDNILNGGENALKFKGKMAVKDIIEGVVCLERIGYLWGKSNMVYRYIINGLGEKMNADIDSMLADDYLKECFAAEIIIQNMKSGYYFDPTDIRKNFKHEKWHNVLGDYAGRYGLI